MSKNNLKTVRFKSEESKSIDLFLNNNPLFESFSSLARLAVMELIQRSGSISWQNIVLHSKQDERPSFLWDYNLSNYQIKKILSHPSCEKKKWLVAKILENAKLEEVMKYLTLEDIKKYLPKLRLKQKTKDKWEYAINIWTEKQ